MASELGVQTIQHTNGTDALVIGSDGSVLAPNQPLVSVRAENAGATSGSSVVPWNIEDIDRGGDFASNVFTAPVSGDYMVNAHVLYDNGTALTSHLVLQKDTGSGFSSYTDAYTQKSSGEYSGVALVCIVNLNSGDKIRLWNEFGTVYGGGGNYHSLCIYLLP